MARSGITVRAAMVVALVVGVASGVLWAVWARSGRLVPEPSLLAAGLLVLIAVLVLALAWPVRRYLHGRARHLLDPVRAARTVALAQAAALTGAAAAGWYGGQLAAVAPDLELLANQGRAWRLLLLTVLSATLCGAGLVAQRWCRVQPPDDPEER
ncbi:MAG TPA: DUF3180 family protein [Dermatophilaceae bacterium]|nr:DUF3180 family protein [Dermatophilaceae bacterium]